ncbi:MULTISPECIES: DUF4382 domain-containing protein [Roseivirga]|jgi:hypothetical protein|uniref:DUF4382 domain-containing protein n=1 Tax=Roseivirga thermotolerans TaxID=1758176 RepID=A0ABQ3I4Q7_9BACT|nr:MULTISPECIES: DUF4382 domain-containing protein [Roseivirga]MEC7754437.1 DUF4382 domain-containing protein [Bacteroidota bacterium]GHE57584.1 hypothetical protein GCM10011340_10800 [Roseivirga thermotolerans]|tara:strand:- start:1637 stop:2551 length:915 start_codon:yes stop_codon:yes gene_type:complete
MKTIKTLIAALIVTTGFVLTSCDDNDNEMSGTGSASFEATDAAVDAENISGVYLSVDELQVIANGKVKNTITFEEPETFDLMAYQNGQTKFLGQTDLDAGSYDEVRLILNSTSQAWVEFTDNTTKQISVPSGSTSGYKIFGDFEVLANGLSEIVLDVDLRKALVKEGNGDFKLRPTARLVSKANAGSIQGKVDMDDMQDADKVVVYAYLEGTYNEAEQNEPAEGRTRFEGSINSAVATATGNFTLAFMPEGKYELIVAKYKENQLNNEVEFESSTKVEVEINGSVMSAFNVKARSVTSLLIDIF